MASISQSSQAAGSQDQFALGAQGAPTLPSMIQQDLRDLFSAAASDSHTLEMILQLAAKYTGSHYVAYFQLDQTKLTPIAVKGKLIPPDDTFSTNDVEQICRTSVAQGEMTTRCVSAEHKLFVIAVPMAANERTPTVLMAVVTPGKTGIGSQMATIERMAAAIIQWRLTDALTRLDWEAHTCAAATELVSRIESSESVLDATYQLVNELCGFLECKQVSLSFPRSAGVGCQVQAISGMAEFDRSSETVEQLTAAMDECLIRQEITCWPPLHAADRHATLAHRKLTQHCREEAALSMPLQTIDDEHVGVLTLTGPRQTLHHDRVQSAVRAFAPHLATALRIRQQAQPSWLERTKQWSFGEKGSTRRKCWTLAAIIAACLIPFVPWGHRVKTDCVVEPVVRRFSVAPYAGILKSSFVQPGDLVTENQSLAKMDDRELRWELSSTMAEWGRARTKRDQAMNEHDTSEAKLAELEMKRLKLKVKMLKNREDQLDVASPLDGVVLKGDLEDAEGAPVKAGQMLFEIAPLDPIKLELAIAEEDLPTVEPEMEIRARLDGYRGPAIRGKIAKIHPRSEIRDSQNVFIAEVELENAEQRLRPGMSGKARIAVGIKPLGWIWFHKAWHKTKTFLGV